VSCSTRGVAPSPIPRNGAHPGRTSVPSRLYTRKRRPIDNGEPQDGSLNTGRPFRRRNRVV
jgi:hypothetical protein